MTKRNRIIAAFIYVVTCGRVSNRGVDAETVGDGEYQLELPFGADPSAEPVHLYKLGVRYPTYPHCPWRAHKHTPGGSPTNIRAWADGQ